MRQVLFYIPLHSLFDFLPDIPIFGYGATLFLAFVFCMWLAIRLGRREGISKEILEKLAIWLFVTGILGARITFMIQYSNLSLLQEPLTWVAQFVQLPDGGLVFYGSFIGGVVGFFLAYAVFLRKHQIAGWKLADVIAPGIALGLALGRVGCLLNGCCYGNVACSDCPAIHFPLPSPPLFEMVRRGHQTAAGFVTDQRTRAVRAVEPNSPAAASGLKLGDKIEKVNGADVPQYDALVKKLREEWPRGQYDLELEVMRGDEVANLTPYRPWTLGLHPTQLYETISMALLLFFLVSSYPFKRYDGSVMVLFMIGYGVHRFLNEMLRTDTDKVAFDMTLSQNISLLLLGAAMVLGFFVWRRGQRAATAAPV